MVFAARTTGRSSRKSLPSKNYRRITGLALAALAVAATLNACAAEQPVDRDRIITRLKEDPRTQGAPDRVVGCVADWYTKYATPEQIRAFLDGETAAQDIERVAPDQQARAAILDCLKSAAGTG
ncbi:hypothetical protein [Actinokineospora enzanensis]|uniref:hypothetical protein n=1 Tax=Actinokineospora enzanensis TaxID=155975 RepID=UPI00038018B5|nr:hypothetical protein [Actinokineospora enzanensis]